MYATVPSFQDVDKDVYRWFEDVRSRDVPVNGALIKEKAQEFGIMLMIEKVFKPVSDGSISFVDDMEL